MIMVRADDLGYSYGVNYGIEHSVKEGIINNVGLMVNMKTSEHGYRLIKNEDISLGLHTNICAGSPVSDPALIPSLVHETAFKSSAVYRSTKTDFVVLEEAIIEIEAQLNRFIEITGQTPDYFDAHAVKSKTFEKALKIVADKNQLDYFELSFDHTRPVHFCGHVVHIWMHHAFKNYEPVKSMIEMIEHPLEGCNLMLWHPGYIDAYLLQHSSLTTRRVWECEAACSKALKEYLKNHHICLHQYKDLKKNRSVFPLL